MAERLTSIALLLVRPGEEGRCFFRNSFSIRSRRFSSSSSCTLHRGKSLVRLRILPPPGIHPVPQGPIVDPRSRATSAIGLPVSMTICTASARNSGLNLRRRLVMNSSSQSGVTVQDHWYTS